MQPQLSETWFKERISAVSDFIASIVLFNSNFKGGQTFLELMDWIQEEIAMRLKSQSAGDQLRNKLGNFTSYLITFIYVCTN